MIFDNGSKICAIEASLNEGRAVVFEYENLKFEFSVIAKMKFEDGKTSNVLLTLSPLNSLSPELSCPV